MSSRPHPPAQVLRRLPAQFTSFVGRVTALNEVTRLVSENRLVTLCGAGGVGKTRLAIQVAPIMAPRFPDGICYLDLAPISDPAVVPMALTRALEIADLPGRSSLERVVRWLGDGRMLLVIDNCEHLIDVCASMVVALMSACPGLTILTTSREPLAAAGELTWRVHPLSLDDEAVALFADRARLARPEFHMGADAAPMVLEVCRQLDGMPLAIELAAARMRAMSLAELANSLQDRFGLLTGGARTALPRHQTLRASVDWSHALLTETERVVFRRLAVFAGGFDAAAAGAVAGDDDIVTNTELFSLVDKSLVTTEENDGLTRYRLLETMRQFALEKLSDSGEFDAIRARHGGYYSALAAELDEPDRAGDQQFIDRVEAEIDNLRAAFAWFRGLDVAAALRLASSLQPLWLGRGHTREGLTWFESITDEIASCPDTAAIVRALSESAMIDVWMGEVAIEKSLAGAQKALVLARNSGDPALLVRALVACGSLLGYNVAAARPYLDEAIGIARATGDRWRLSQILFWQAAGAFVAGDPTVGREAAEEGLEIAEAIGDRYVARLCGVWLGFALLWQGHVEDAIAQFESLITEDDWGTDLASRAVGLLSLAQALAYRGDTAAARKVSDEAVAAASEFGGVYEGSSHAVVTYVALAAADVATAVTAAEAAWRLLRPQPDMAAMFGPIMAQTALAGGDVTAARDFADAAVDTAPGWHRMFALITRARVALAQGEFREAERDALAALACAVKGKAYLCVADAIECVAAAVAGAVVDGLVAARLAGAAESARKRTGESRFQVFQASYDSFVGELRDAIGDEQLASAWADGARLSIEQAIAYAQRGRGERKRPSSGWAALTPTEREVVRFVSRGLSNSEIASELFISVRTVQTHLTHVYAKLGAKSRIQIARQAARYV